MAKRRSRSRSSGRVPARVLRVLAGELVVLGLLVATIAPTMPIFSNALFHSRMPSATNRRSAIGTVFSR